MSCEHGIGRHGRTRLEYHIPARGLIGFQSDFMTMTRGTGLMSHVFDDYAPVKPDMHAPPSQWRADFTGKRRGCCLCVVEPEDRGRMFVSPGDKLYEHDHHIHSRDNDLVVNPIMARS